MYVLDSLYNERNDSRQHLDNAMVYVILNYIVLVNLVVNVINVNQMRTCVFTESPI